METPYNLAFETEAASKFTDNLLSSIIDILFMIDIVIIFNTAYYTEDMELIEDRKSIAKSYLKGWFIIDLLAVIPFDIILNATQFNSLVRVARFGRLYKLVKLTRLLRILKIMKEKNKLMKYLNQILKIGLGFERLFFFILIFFLLCHISSCLWIVVA